MFQREPEVRGVKRDGASDVLHLVSHAVDTHDEGAWLSLARSSGLSHSLDLQQVGGRFIFLQTRATPELFRHAQCNALRPWQRRAPRTHQLGTWRLREPPMTPT